MSRESGFNHFRSSSVTSLSTVELEQSSESHRLLPPLVLEGSSLRLQEWLSSQSQELICELQILISLFLFGVSYVGQKQAMINGMQPITFNFCRYFVSTVVLFLLKYVWGLKIQRKSEPRPSSPNIQSESSKSFTERYQLIFYSLVLGICNYGGSVLEQIGLVTVTAGKTSFIVGMFVVFVPLVEFVFLPKYRGNMSISSVVSVLLSFSGLYLLSGCVEAEVCIGGAIGKGEMIVFLSMWCWVLFIIITDAGAKNVEAFSLTFYEFIVVTLLTLLSAVAIEPENFVYPYPSITSNWAVILAIGVTEAFAFTFSVLGQMHTPPTRASILFSMQSVVCAVLSFFFLNERLSWVEVIGAMIMTSAVLGSSVFSPVKEEELEEDKAELEQSSLLGYDNIEDGRDEVSVSPLLSCTPEVSPSSPKDNPQRSSYYQYNHLSPPFLSTSLNEGYLSN